VNLNLRDRFDQLGSREQKLLLVLGAAFGVMAVAIVPAVLAVTASSRKKDNDAMRDVIAAIADARPKLAEQDAVRRKIAARYARPTPALAGLLEQLASAHGIEIPESQDRPPVPRGNKKFEERSTKIELQKVGMKNLVTFLESIETSGFPVRVSALSIRRRTEPDAWDVSISVSAFERKEPDKAKPAASAVPEGAGK
jgi:general secretion pathway protein M